MAEPPVLALIGDLVASREHPRRQEVQAELRRKLAALDEDLGPDVLGAPIALGAGDEVQALLRVPSHAVRVVQELTDHLQTAPLEHGPLEQEIAFGLGWGALSTGPLPPPPARAESTALLDGPCFHAARTALERAQKQRLWVACGGLGGSRDLVLESLFELMGAIRGRWAPMQSRYALQMRRHGQQKGVAEEFGVSPSVISESLKAARFEAVLRGEEAARALLSALDPRPAAEEAG